MLLQSILKNYRIFIAVQAVDFRKGINGLSALCQPIFAREPCEQHIFVFRNRRSQACKILFYEKQGFWLCMKRLSHGKFLWWPKSKEHTYFQCELKQLEDILFNHMPSELSH